MAAGRWQWRGAFLPLSAASSQPCPAPLYFAPRCRATTANPDTGRIDADTLATLNSAYGHQEFGVYAVVEQGGTIQLDDEVQVI